MEAHAGENRTDVSEEVQRVHQGVPKMGGHEGILEGGLERWLSS